MVTHAGRRTNNILPQFFMELFEMGSIISELVVRLHHVNVLNYNAAIEMRVLSDTRYRAHFVFLALCKGYGTSICILVVFVFSNCFKDGILNSRNYYCLKNYI